MSSPIHEHISLAPLFRSNNSVNEKMVCKYATTTHASFSMGKRRCRSYLHYNEDKCKYGSHSHTNRTIPDGRYNRDNRDSDSFGIRDSSIAHNSWGNTHHPRSLHLKA